MKREDLADYRKAILTVALCIVAGVVVVNYEGKRIELLAFIVALSSAFTTYTVHMTPSIRFDVGPLEKGKLVTPFVLENLSNVSGRARVLMEVCADGKHYSAKGLSDGEGYYSWKSQWRFTGKDVINGHFDVAKLLPGRAVPENHLALRVTAQWYTSFGLPVDAFTRYWVFRKDVWSWSLDVGGVKFEG